MEITHKDREEFLKAYNELRIILQTMHECQDIWMSDIGKLESMERLIHKTMKFVPQTDDDGRSIYYADWVLEEIDEDH